MNLIILGSGTGVPAADRASPALVLTSMDRPILFDVGPGTLGRLARIGIAHHRIGHIFITHFHPDHTTDLVHLLFATRNPPILRQREPFTLVGPRGIKAFLKSLESAYGDWIRIPDRILKVEEMDPLNEERRSFNGFQVLSRPTFHAAPSLAYRVTSSSGRSFVYTGDTGYSPGLGDFAKDCDLLITEASFPEGQEMEGHLTPAQAGTIAARARAAKLVLVHFYPEVLRTDIVSQCRKTFDGPIILGRDRLHLRV